MVGGQKRRIVGQRKGLWVKKGLGVKLNSSGAQQKLIGHKNRGALLAKSTTHRLPSGMACDGLRLTKQWGNFLSNGVKDQAYMGHLFPFPSLQHSKRLATLLPSSFCKAQDRFRYQTCKCHCLPSKGFRSWGTSVVHLDGHMMGIIPSGHGGRHRRNMDHLRPNVTGQK